MLLLYFTGTHRSIKNEPTFYFFHFLHYNNVNKKLYTYKILIAGEKESVRYE